MNRPRKFFRRPDSLRLQSHDYSEAGAYFVTLCTIHRECLLGEVVDGRFVLSDAGRIAQAEWMDIPGLHSSVLVDAFVVMPNHVHGILIFTDHLRTLYRVDEDETIQHGRAIHESPLQAAVRLVDSRTTKKDRRNMGLSKVVGRFKMKSARRINEVRGTPGVPVWQRGYYDHIIRNEQSLHRLRKYIVNNPLRWALDKENVPPCIPGTRDADG